MNSPASYALQGEQFLRTGLLHRALGAFTLGLQQLDDAVSAYKRLATHNKGFHGDSQNRFHVQVLDQRAILLLGRARASYRLGRLSGTIIDLHKLFQILNADNVSQESEINRFEVLSRAHQCIACVYVLIGADKLAERELESISKLASGMNFNSDISGILDAWADSPPVTYSASDWHCARRISLVHEHPSAKKLLLDKGDNSGLFLVWFTLALFLVQLVLAIVIGRMPFASSVTWLLVLAPSVGAVCAYGFQALNHELSHQLAHRRLTYFGMCVGSSLCNFPWAMYYSQYHARHHAYTGEAKDRDGDILFLPWHSPPTLSVDLEAWVSKSWVDRIDKRLDSYGIRLSHTPTWDMSANWYSRLVWSVISASLIYPLFSLRKYIYDTAHLPVLEFEGLMVFVQGTCWWVGGWMSLVYIWTAAAFSLGALGHPYIGFWLIQHACSVRSVNGTKYPRVEELVKRVRLIPKQPTVSYTGSRLWNRLNFSELLHVEHHDLPRTPCYRAEKLSQIAPEFYDDLSPCVSILGAIRGWIFARSNREWMQQNGDFAGRMEHLYLEQVRNEQEENLIDDESSRQTDDEEFWLEEELETAEMDVGEVTG